MNTMERVELKDITDINLKSLEDALSQAIRSQVGGHLDVRLAHFDTGGTGGSQIELVFRVFDDCPRERPRNDGRDAWSAGQV